MPSHNLKDTMRSEKKRGYQLDSLHESNLKPAIEFLKNSIEKEISKKPPGLNRYRTEYAYSDFKEDFNKIKNKLPHLSQIIEKDKKSLYREINNELESQLQKNYNKNQDIANSEKIALSRSNISLQNQLATLLIEADKKNTKRSAKIYDDIINKIQDGTYHLTDDVRKILESVKPKIQPTINGPKVQSTIVELPNEEDFSAELKSILEKKNIPQFLINEAINTRYNIEKGMHRSRIIKELETSLMGTYGLDKNMLDKIYALYETSTGDGKSPEEVVNYYLMNTDPLKTHNVHDLKKLYKNIVYEHDKDKFPSEVYFVDKEERDILYDYAKKNKIDKYPDETANDYVRRLRYMFEDEMVKRSSKDIPEFLLVFARDTHYKPPQSDTFNQLKYKFMQYYNITEHEFDKLLSLYSLPNTDILISYLLKHKPILRDKSADEIIRDYYEPYFDSFPTDSPNSDLNRTLYSYSLDNNIKKQAGESSKKFHERLFDLYSQDIIDTELENELADDVLYANGWFSDVKEKVKHYFAPTGSPQTDKIIKEFGDWKVTNACIHRKPVDKILKDIINVLTSGKFNTYHRFYDDVFHLAVIFEIEAPGSLNKKYLLTEKRPNIFWKQVSGLDDYPGKDKLPVKLESFKYRDITLEQMIEECKKIMGDKFAKYNAKDNNCQIYILALFDAFFKLAKTGSTMHIIKNYIYQDMTPYLTDFSVDIASKVTDLGHVFNRILNGAGAHPRGHLRSRDKRLVAFRL